MQSLKNFSVKDSFDYKNTLNEAIETILSANVELSSKNAATRDSLETIVEPLRKLKEAQALFAPKLTVQLLSEKDFEERGVPITNFFQNQMINHSFYFVQVPITLKPSFGWSFARLECWLGFDSNNAKIHDLYPDDEWTDILNVHTGFNLGLNGDLKFSAGIDPSILKPEIDLLPESAKAKLSFQTGAKLKLFAGPFDYNVWRTNIIARGRENSEAFWQLDGDAKVQQQEPFLAVVLRVPKGTRSLNAQGALIAYHDFNFWSAHLKDFWGDFREKVKTFFTSGVPIEKEIKWDNIIQE